MAVTGRERRGGRLQAPWPIRCPSFPRSDQLSTPSIHQRLRVGPAQNQNVALPHPGIVVGIHAAGGHQHAVAEHPDEHGRLEVRGLDHGDAGGGVVEVLQVRRERRQERRQVVVVQQGLVAGRVGELHLGQARAQGVGREVVQRVAVDLGDARAQVAAHQVAVALELGLDHDQGEVGLGVRVARHLLDLFDLVLDVVVDALEEAIGGPAVGGEGVGSAGVVLGGSAPEYTSE